jgi:hypothetical protein
MQKQNNKRILRSGHSVVKMQARNVESFGLFGWNFSTPRR